MHFAFNYSWSTHYSATFCLIICQDVCLYTFGIHLQLCTYIHTYIYRCLRTYFTNVNKTKETKSKKLSKNWMYWNWNADQQKHADNKNASIYNINFLPYAQQSSEETKHVMTLFIYFHNFIHSSIIWYIYIYIYVCMAINICL